MFLKTICNWIKLYASDNYIYTVRWSAETINDSKNYLCRNLSKKHPQKILVIYEQVKEMQISSHKKGWKDGKLFCCVEICVRSVNTK